MSGVDPGCVRLRLQLADGRISRVDVSSQRPAVANLLQGRPAAEAERLLPLLFAVCGRAQGRAARLAIAAARGEDCAHQLDPEIVAEAMREHLWRWLLDLPPLLGLVPLKEAFAAGVGWIRAGDRPRIAGLLANPQVMEIAACLDASADPDPPPTALLPTLDARQSLEFWPRIDAAFCRQPNWRGAPAETGALARAGGRGGPASRWRARLDELRAWVGDRSASNGVGGVSACPLAPGVGRAVVETARGLLMHEVALEGERVASYVIVAPTEWNFHPAGALPAGLSGAPASDQAAAEGLARLAMAALDPCVRQEIEWL